MSGRDRPPVTAQSESPGQGQTPSVVAAAGHSAFDLSALYYDLLRGGEDDPSLALALVREGDTVVDVGAGTGANTVALAPRGATVQALEPNLSMRIAFNARIARHPELWPLITLVPLGVDDVWESNPRYRQADHVAQLALCLGVIHMLSPASRRTMLRNLHSCLCDDGLLVIDGVTPLGEAVHSLDVVLGRAHVGAHVTVGRLQTRQGPDGTWLTSVGYEITDEAGVTQSELVQYPSWPCRAQELGDDLRAGGFDVVDMSADEMSRIRSLDRPDVVVARVSGQSKRP